MYTILICDDEKDIRSALRIYLTREGYRVMEAADGREALDVIANESVDLLLLDWMMPVMDGLTVLTALRKFSSLPVILLTAKSEEEDKIDGLNLGADDYITKPFHSGELLARVKAVLRRYAMMNGAEDRASVIAIGGIVLDDEKKTVACEGELVMVTPKEYDILYLLMANPGKVFSSKEIYQLVWKDIPLGPEGQWPFTSDTSVRKSR